MTGDVGRKTVPQTGKDTNELDTLTVKALVSVRMRTVPLSYPADLTVSKRPGTSSRIEIHFAVFNRLYLLFSFMKLVRTW